MEKSITSKTSAARFGHISRRKSHYHGYLLHPKESIDITISFGGKKIPWRKNCTTKKQPDYNFNIEVALNDEVYLMYIYDTECMDIVKVTKDQTEITYFFTNRRKSIPHLLANGTNIVCNYKSQVHTKDGDRNVILKGDLYGGSLFHSEGATIPEYCIFTTRRYHEVRPNLEMAHPQLKRLDYQRKDPQRPSNCRIS